jgi:hypothetical protein
MVNLSAPLPPPAEVLRWVTEGHGRKIAAVALQNGRLIKVSKGHGV